MFRRIVIAAELVAYKAAGLWSFGGKDGFCGRDDLERINRARFVVLARTRVVMPYNRIIRDKEGNHYLALVLRLPERFVPVFLNLSAVVYMALGVYGWQMQVDPEMITRMSEDRSLVYGLLAALSINGVFFFGDLTDRIRAAKDAVARKRREMFGGR